MKTPWNEKTLVQKILFVAAILGSAVAVFLIAFAITFSVEKSTDLGNTKDTIEIDITITDVNNQAQAVKPGTEQTITTTITNEWDKPMYLFVRADVSTYTTNSGTLPIYSFAPSDSSWIQVETGEAGELVFAYTDGTAMCPIESEEEIVFSGTLTCEVPKKVFGQLTDDDMKVKFTGCALDTETEGKDPTNVYGQYASR